MTTSDISLDTSGLDDLNALLQAAIEKTPRERAKALDATARTVAARASATAGSYTKGTGDLANSVTVSGSDLTKLVGADLREAWFLEVGSPSTGAPRPWLTGPAMDEVAKLLTKLGEVGELW